MAPSDGEGRPAPDAAWSTRFVPGAVEATETTLRIDAADEQAGLALVSEVEALPGGLLRGRHVLTSTGAGAYVLTGLEVVLPVPDDLVELLDLTGRHEGERSPQRHAVTDGLWLREGRSALLLLPAAVSLAVFAWLLTLHPTGAARTYAAYGGVYIAVALVWLWLVEGDRPTVWDLVGALVAMMGMAIIVLGPRR